VGIKLENFFDYDSGHRQSVLLTVSLFKVLVDFSLSAEVSRGHPHKAFQKSEKIQLFKRLKKIQRRMQNITNKKTKFERKVQISFATFWSVLCTNFIFV
jgi:hypothetical protein